METSTSDVGDLSLMEAIYEKHKDDPGALIPVLQEAQAAYGFLPPNVLASVADRFGIAVGKVHAVATFYSELHLERQGTHTLKICDGTVCHLEGSSQLIGALDHRYGIGPGETTPDGELTVEVVYCLGACALAPATELDGTVMGSVEEGKLLEDLETRIASASALPRAGEEESRSE